MRSKDEVLNTIQKAFAATEFPGDEFLQGSYEGSEPFEAVARFKGKDNWQTLDAAFLDVDPAAIGFFSEAAFRFYLPAYLIADLRGELYSADILFHLTHGFHEGSVEVPVGSQLFVRKFGRSAFVNPQRYGAMTWGDHARFRLSIFPREEAQAIVAYLEYKGDADQSGLEQPVVETALQKYWLARASHAPLADNLQEHLAQEARFIAAISDDTTP